MVEAEFVSSAEKNQVKVYGMSRVYSDLSKQETTETVLLGYSTMGIDDIGKVVLETVHFSASTTCYANCLYLAFMRTKNLS